MISFKAYGYTINQNMIIFISVQFAHSKILGLIPLSQMFIFLKFNLKGQCHEIFKFWFFSWISFPQAPDYTIMAVLKFFENSRRYSQLKFCHWCQQPVSLTPVANAKIFNIKVFII